MGMIRYAELKVLSSWIADEDATLSRASGQPVGKIAKRWQPTYNVRKGFLYVRSRAISSRINDNYDEFPAEEIENGYKSFIGKPVFVNHHNDDPNRARGVIIDATLHRDRNPDGTPDTWVEVLMEVDAVRFPKLAKAILSGRVNRTSMGCNVRYSVCTVCGNKATNPAEFCDHIPTMKGLRITRTTASGTKEAVVCAERCYGLEFFENSILVEPPADPTAYFLGVDDSGLAKSAALYDHPLTPPGQGFCVALVNQASSVCPCSEYVPGPMMARSPVCDRCGHTSQVHVGDIEVVGKRKTGPTPDRVSTTARQPARLANVGDVVAPEPVDTLRDESCPVCGETSSFQGDVCSTCGYIQPPDIFKDPDLTKAREFDRGVGPNQADPSQQVATPPSTIATPPQNQTTPPPVATPPAVATPPGPVATPPKQSSLLDYFDVVVLHRGDKIPVKEWGTPDLAEAIRHATTWWQSGGAVSVYILNRATNTVFWADSENTLSNVSRLVQV